METKRIEPKIKTKYDAYNENLSRIAEEPLKRVKSAHYSKRKRAQNKFEAYDSSKKPFASNKSSSSKLK